MGSAPIRTMRGDEEDAVRALLIEANDEILRSFPPNVASEYLAEMGDLESRRPFSTVLVAGEPELSGCVTFLPDSSNDNHPWPAGGSVIRLLAVAPGEQGKGVGRRLVEECLMRAGSAGASFVGLHTAPAMVAAQRLYEGLGFVRAPVHDFDPYAHFTPGVAPESRELWGLAYVRTVQ